MTVETLTTPYSVFVQDENILINGYKQFAILQKRPNEAGFQGITFSIPITEHDVACIASSGIAQVVSFSESGTLKFKRKAFYENTKMYELIIDILNRYEKKDPRQHMA